VTGGWSFVIWIIVIAIPMGIVLGTHWARSRLPGAARLDSASADDPRDPA